MANPNPTRNVLHAREHWKRSRVATERNTTATPLLARHPAPVRLDARAYAEGPLSQLG